MAAKPNKNAPLGQGGRFAAVKKAAGGGAKKMGQLSAKGRADAAKGK